MGFGQSAGSMLLDMYTLAFREQPLLHSVIGESGCATSGFQHSNKGAKWAKVAQSVGCPTGAAGLDCMRKKSDAEITKGVGKAGRVGVGGPFSPVVDGKIIWSDAQSTARAKQGLFAKVVSWLARNRVNEELTSN
jgi:carboxylesterase type B